MYGNSIKSSHSNYSLFHHYATSQLFKSDVDVLRKSIQIIVRNDVVTAIRLVGCTGMKFCE